MSEFSLYFKLGREHIMDINGYDHILFIIALCAVYLLRDWKKVLILVTAFTIGHSITLALSVLDIIKVNTDIIEFLIPVTIFITAVSNIVKKERSKLNGKIQLNYFFALFFGLIHGLGFSNYLRALIGKDQSVVTQLLAFNLGIEFGQIVIVLVFLLASFMFINIFNVAKTKWTLIISSAIMGIALTLLIETKFW